MKRYVCALIALVITFSGSAYAAEEIMARYWLLGRFP